MKGLSYGKFDCGFLSYQACDPALGDEATRRELLARWF